jgi:hypothetical protein
MHEAIPVEVSEFLSCRYLPLDELETQIEQANETSYEQVSESLHRTPSPTDRLLVHW